MAELLIPVVATIGTKLMEFLLNTPQSASENGGAVVEKTKEGGGGGGADVKPQKNRDQIAKIKGLEQDLKRYRKQHAELLERFDELAKQLKDKKIETFEQLAEQDKEAKKQLVMLAKQTTPAKLDGVNIALFGSTSTGKSTLLNGLLGQKVAATGVGETTTEITPYPGARCTYWDVPGRNDEVSYFSMEYVSFFKGLTRRLILIQSTVKENSSIMKLLDEIDLNYDIIFNKFDKVDEEERDSIRQQIRKEVTQLGLRGAKKIFFISAKNPKTHDWVEMVNHLTG